MCVNDALFCTIHTQVVMPKNANARTKGKVSKRPQCPKSRGLLAEAESGAVGVPVVVQPVPTQPNLVAMVVETRDMQVAVVVLRDRAPQEHRLVREQLEKDSDSLT